MTERKATAYKNPYLGSCFDGFMTEQGLHDEARSRAIKGVISWQIADQMKRHGISRSQWPR
jgi:hypothetical protein